MVIRHRLLLGTLVLALLGGYTSAGAQSVPVPNPNCTPNDATLPMGQSSLATGDPQQSLWCYPLSVGPTTRVSGQNDWLDNFQSGAGLQRFDNGDLNYGVYGFNSVDQGQPRIVTRSATTGDYFAVDMADVSPYRLSGGVMTSPQRSFTFEGSGASRRLVVEADFTAGNFNVGGADVFYEMDISPAPAPTGIQVDSLYGYGAFGGAGAVGCRFQGESGVGETVCSFYNNSTRDAGGADVTCATQPNCPGNGLPGRIWETQGAGGPVATVNQVYNTSGFWRQCQANADDAQCFDRFRMELGKDFLLVYVNGALQREIRGMTTGRSGQDARIPDSWLSPTGVHVYYTDWINGGQHATNRFFWDRLAVNPHNPDGSPMARSVADSFCPLLPLLTCIDGAPLPTSTPGPAVTATATRTALPATPVPTNTPPATAVVAGATATVSCRVSVWLDGGTPGPYRPC